jgi:hypothetical protein
MKTDRLVSVARQIFVQKQREIHLTPDRCTEVTSVMNS